LPKETGLCKGYFPRYYFDSTEKKCLEFVYGGCGGNKNNFFSKEHCDQECSNNISDDYCTLEKDNGPCRGYFPKYYFSTIEKKCLPFIFGGCLGNKNNFSNQMECEKSCSKYMN